VFRPEFRFRCVFCRNFGSGKCINFDMLCLSVSVSFETFQYFYFGSDLAFDRSLVESLFLSCAWTSCNRCYVE
jgi:hypothetical protein